MNIFDVIGPVMIGPSSSHTAGAVRLGNLALSILGEDVKEAVIGLHGSFAQTYRGHGTDVALVAGLQGWATDDERIPKSFEVAKDAGIAISFKTIQLGDFAHPNSVRFWLTGVRGNQCVVTGKSIGGGRVVITSIDDFPVEFSGDFPTILTMHYDRPGAIAIVTSILSTQGVNVAQMKVFRKEKGGLAAMIVETDQPIDDRTYEGIGKLPHIQSVRRIQLV
ncbi:L-serine ammonia-lyase, iron-sulfur-dependent subunit beta [Pelosinus sp. IPA-1]|uniref:L-serine ammonia-lyase, iron-sulfur-dependent subunit beta n=1 Tax=Pelosinus sp. IPA-1 TaxID=3029569 RepID=UPI0024362441|nr:L-serine ammonia-lyase, iron-sulfur-dependent subunit beta [Pelosinus sp. IPA-1]GMB00765.1 L-serine dehydratase, iron-sulfur-dependent subunit beta [Pelosinus sp. IPA-1]